MTLSDLARLLRMPTSTCFGLMRTLQARGYLYEVGGRKSFYPTARWLAMARKIESKDPILEQLQPYLDKLRDLTGETVVLSKLMGDSVVYLNVVESTQSIRYTSGVGDLKPVASTSSGKALMSAVAPREREALLARLRNAGGTRLTSTQKTQMNEEIDRSRKRGWYVGRGENVIDVMGVAAPVHAAGDIFSITVAGPMNRMEPKLHQHAKQLIWVCKALLKK